MRNKVLIICLIALVTIGNSVTAQEWQTPVIDGYGKVKYFKDAAGQPDKNEVYKILYHITSDVEREGVNKGLWHIARQVNLFGAAGVPAENVKIVALISGSSTDIVLNNKAYKKKHLTVNPNLELMKKLTDYGVKIEVCGQAAAGKHIDPETDLNEYTDFTLSALMAIPIYQNKGYHLMF